MIEQYTRNIKRKIEQYTQYYIYIFIFKTCIFIEHAIFRVT